jgi:hypothetical protein
MTERARPKVDRTQPKGNGSVRLAESEEEALAANALLPNNSKMVGRVWRNEVLRKQRKNGLAVAIDGTGVVVGCAMFSVKA